MAVPAAVGLTFYCGAVAFLPALVAIILSEAFRWRSLLFFLIAGAIIGIVGDQIYPVDTAPTERRLVLALAAGIVGGFVYWLIAGHNAGWRGSNATG